jgi:ketosteroid isomerase-like protein
MMRSIACTLAVLLAVTSAATPPPEPESAPPLPSVILPPELDRVLRDYEKAWQARDAAGLAALFAEDGFVLASSRRPVRGRPAIRAAYSGAGGPLALRALAYSTEGGVGYIIGAFGRVKGGEESGKFVLALRRGDDGRWLIAADMDNSNRRPSASPATTAPGATSPPR